MDFLQKPVRRVELLQRVRRALELDARLHEEEEAERQARRNYASLSPREQQVMALVVAGLSSKEIAAELYLSSNTVRTHLYNLYGKLAVHSRVQAVNRGRELGLLAE